MPQPRLTKRALHDLRRRRQRNRLDDLEWFDAAYKVYLVALFGGGGVLWLASIVGDEELDAAQASDVLTHAPAVLGVLAALGVLLGLRNGAQGGPLALEAADVMHVMLSPVDRRGALLRPATQRVRSALSTGAILGAIAGQLAGYRLPGTPLAWTGSGALFGATVAALWAGTALVAHAGHPPLWAVTTLGTTLLGWQIGAVFTDVAGPFDAAGGVALWGARQRPVELVPLLAGLVLVGAGMIVLARTSMEALARRASLVAQLRFAVTMQDLRTVILLRRQLNQEQMRRRPWFTVPRLGRHPALRRSWQSHARLPLARLVRTAALAATVGLTAAVTVKGTTGALPLAGLAAFLLGLEVLEPLSQEIDQPDRTESFPVERGPLMSRLMAASMVLLVPFAIVAGAAAVLTVRTSEAVVPALILSLPVVLAGACGAVVSIVRDAPDPFADSTNQAFMPPEMAGMATALRVLIPIAVSVAGVAPVLILRTPLEDGSSLPAAAARSAIGSVFVVVLTAAWVHWRDRLRQRFRAFMAEGRAHTQQQRTSM
jgi:hypothetical protein